MSGLDVFTNGWQLAGLMTLHVEKPNEVRLRIKCVSPMVKSLKRKGRTIYVCEVCGLGYSDISTAEACKKFCSENCACSTEITKKAIYYPHELATRYRT